MPNSPHWDAVADETVLPEIGSHAGAAETRSSTASPQELARLDQREGAESWLGSRVEQRAGLVPYGILVYFAIQVVLRIAISANLEIDEAEIAQHGYFAVGYGNSNPPLYDWVVIALWRLTSSWPVALAIAKNGLLASTYLLLFSAGRLLFGTKAGAATLALPLLLMPQVVWQAQVTLSHATAGAAASAATIAVLAWLLDRKTTIRFVAFGLALGAVLLSKYSAILLLGALVCAIPPIAPARRQLSDRRLILSAAIAVVMAAPHYLWVLFNLKTSTARLVKLEKLDPIWSRLDVPVLGIDGLIKLLQALVTSAAPLLIIWAVARWVAREEASTGALTPLGALFGRVAGRALAAGLVIAGAAVLLDDVHHVFDRYLTQFLLLLPVWLSLRFPLAFRPRAVRRLLRASLGLAATVTLAWPQIALFGDHRFAYPYDSVARRVVEEAGPDAAILMDRSDYAANIALRMPKGRLYRPGVPSSKIAVLWDPATDQSAALFDVAGQCYRPDGSVRQIVQPFHYFSGNVARLSLAVLDFDPVATPMGGDCDARPDPLPGQH